MASEIKVDTVSEKTSANGVTIDGVKIKDSALATAGSVPLSTIDIDGGTDIGAAIVDADLFIVDDGAGGTNRKTTASRLKTYIGGSDPASADGDSLGTASLEWSDLYLADGGQILFGNDQDVLLTHVADTGLTIKTGNSTDDRPVILTLANAELLLTTDEVIGKIQWQAPDEASGTDAILVSAAIQAVAEGAHSASSNATRLEFMTGASEAATSQMSISSGGIVGIGAVPTGDLGVGLHVKSADSGASVDSEADELVIEGSGHAGISILSGNSSHGKIYFGDDGDNNVGKIQYSHSANGFDIVAGATDVGNWKSNGLGLFCNADTTRLKVETDVDGEKVMQLRHGDADNPTGIEIQYYGGSPDNTGDDVFAMQDSTTTRIVIASDGDIRNHDNAYGQISDERIKQGIKDANSQWDDIKALRVRNFTRKDDVRQYGENAWEQIGLIAQEAELVSPKLIKECKPDVSDIESDASFGTIIDDENNPKCYLPKDTLPEGKKVGDPVLDESGNPTYDKKVGEVNSKVKGIKYSVLYMKAIKALQEAQTRIETLEAKVAVLEG